MTALQKLAADFYSQLEYKKRNNGDGFFCIKDAAKDKDQLQEIIRLAHDDKMPDDYIYQYSAESLEAIADYPDPLDYLNDIQPDVYSHDLMAWLGSHYDRKELLNDAIKEFGFTELDIAISYAQVMEKELVFHSILESLNGIIDNLAENAA